MNLPPHIEYSIKCEEEAIKLREAQIASYKKKIELLKAGFKPSDVLKKCPAIQSKMIFDAHKYGDLKRKWEDKNG